MRIQKISPKKIYTEPLIVEVPGSKSITNRALLLATLAEGDSTLEGVLFSDDSRHFLDCIQTLGFTTVVDETSKTITVTGHGGKIPRQEASLYVGSAGTAARFLTALLGISHGTWHMDASEQMRRRPMAPLLDSLAELGCKISYPESSFDIESADGNPSAIGYFPFVLHANGFTKQEITIDIEQSSQFLSALLISACLSEEDFMIHVKGTHGMAYIEMTCKMMQQFGITVTQPSPDTFLIRKGQSYLARNYRIEPDVSAAATFMQ